MPNARHHVARSSSYCTSCHEGWSGDQHLPGHQEVSCQSCHTVPKGDELAMYVAATVGVISLPDHGAVDDGTCSGCHEKDEIKWRGLMLTYGHTVHAEGSDLVDCIRCHSRSLHGDPQPEEGCLSCHGDVPLHSEPRSEADCTICHDFGGTDEETVLTGVALDAQGVEAWASRVGIDQVHGSADCGLCHNPHQAAAERLQITDCTTCHRGDLASTFEDGPEAHPTCAGCHDAHMPREELVTLCSGCHARPQLDDPGLREGIADAPPGESHEVLVARVVTQSPISLQELEERTHQGSCPTCHQPHTWRASRDGCPECHEDQRTMFAEGRGNAHEQCVRCHEPHAAPPTRQTCAQCHQANASRRNTPTRHQDCMSCHEPHRNRPRNSAVCTSSCHIVQRNGMREGPEPHRDCQTCHTPHGDPTAATLSTCARCHAAEVASVSRNPEHRRCIGCHARHNFDRSIAGNSCIDCHSNTVSGDGPHSGACATCHAPHSRGPTRATRCASCHEEVRPAIRQHATRCNGCHEPHRPAAAARTACQNCHQRQASVARMWPAESPHRDSCVGCHQKHNERTKVACGSCHEDRNNQGHMGPHRECQGCHAPHEAPAASPSGYWGRCANCHQEQAAGVRQSTGDHRQCSSCHDNPGRAPTPCRTCHEQQPQLLHQHAEHQRCNTCHGEHRNRIPTRAQCLSCHTESRTHFADAPNCQSCHPFKPE